MPPTRRSSRNAAAKGLGRQSTLSFNNKVSKAGATKLSAKEAAAAAAAVTSPSPASPAAERKESAEEAELIEAPVSAQVDEVDIEEEEQSGVQKLEKAPAAKLKSSPAEARAEKVTDAQIKKYWRDVEAARIAKRVHQEELSLAEKVLRYFDISSQYGPCIGIPRTKRWHRAEKLGLNPPIEVLAVLIKEENQGRADIETSAMDRHLSSTAIGGL